MTREEIKKVIMNVHSPLTVSEAMYCIDIYAKQIKTDAIDEFAHNLKETFNNEFPSNYHCTQPYFTLDNVRVLVDAVTRELKEQNNDSR